MVLVDTSVWIRSMAGKEPFRTIVDRLLDRESVLGHELVYGELLIGDAGARSAMLTHYRRFSYVESVPHEEVVALVRERRLFGRGVGWIDAHLLASSLVSRAQLYTADAPLAGIARGLGIAYAPAQARP
jgi:predicted nucleic acid-binding protein